MLGATSLQLARTLAVDEGWLVGVMHSADVEDRVVARSGYFALSGFSPELTPDQRAFFDSTVAIDPAQPLVGQHLYTGDQLVEIRRRIAPALAAHAGLTPAAARDAVGLSRKYVVPLLEYFDAVGVTVRDGDRRRPR
jgi:hypothetical protein